jgi:hypothetical protein
VPLILPSMAPDDFYMLAERRAVTHADVGHAARDLPSPFLQELLRVNGAKPETFTGKTNRTDNLKYDAANFDFFTANGRRVEAPGRTEHGPRDCGSCRHEGQRSSSRRTDGSWTSPATVSFCHTDGPTTRTPYAASRSPFSGTQTMGALLPVPSTGSNVPLWPVRPHLLLWPVFATSSGQ